MIHNERLKSVLYLVRQLRPYRLKMVISVICGIIKEISTLSGIAICAYLAALAFEGKTFSAAKWLLAVLACAILRGLCAYLESFISHDVAYHALIDYRLRLYDRFIGLCPEILLKQRSGQVSTTLMNDIEQLEWFYGHTYGEVFGVTFLCTGLLIIAGMLHWSLLLAAAVSMFFIILIPLLMRGIAEKQGLESRLRLGEANSVTLEGIDGMNEILTLNYQWKHREKSKFFMNRLTDIQVAYAKRMGIEGALLQAVSGLCALSIDLIAASLMKRGILNTECFAIVAVTAWVAFQPLVNLSMLARNFGTVFGASKRVADVMKQSPVVEDKGTLQNSSQIEPSIQFDHVSFNYRKKGPDTLQDVSFKVNAGETVALVGESGAGKTTCIHLLGRLWDVDSGKISIGGREIKDFSLHTLHDIASVVLQDVYLFNASIADNIRLGRPNATIDEVIHAAKMAQVHDFISSLPQGYKTTTGERGIQLSGGQRQRIAIARAILKDSPILILDEAVSNLDTVTDAQIQETIRTLGHNKTILMVAHRLSTILEADRLIVMKNGTIVQTGTHSQLMQEDGYYRQLIAAQLQKDA